MDGKGEKGKRWKRKSKTILEQRGAGVTSLKHINS